MTIVHENIEIHTAIDAQDIDALFKALENIKNKKDVASILSCILLEEWHEAHEDIVFELGLIGDPCSIEAITKAIEIPFSHLVQWNNLHEFQRKCAYALARINIPDSRAALEVLAKHKDPFLKQYGMEGLEKWPL